jgi:choline dehydrogenase-like flavoprotein
MEDPFVRKILGVAPNQLGSIQAGWGMITSSNDLSQSNLQHADVCIVGAGAAGITLACELDGSGLNVILLEAGGLRAEIDSADYYAGTATDPHPDPTQYRRTAFGGTTSVWGGRCVPLEPIDFERRDYVPESGWPISYAEVAQYYPRALTYCDAGKFDFSIAGALARPSPTIGGFDDDGGIVTEHIERYSLPTDFGKRYREQIAKSANVTAVLYARCIKLHKRPGDDAIECVDLIDRAGRVRRLASRVVVLAAGGIEVPRLLMNSAADGEGLGNRNDLLGRFYQCHFESISGRLASNGAAVAFDFEKTTDGIYCRRQLRLSENAQREHRLLNMGFRLHFPEYSDSSHRSSIMSAIYLAKSMLPAEHRAILQHGKQSNSSTPALPHVRNIVAGLPQLAKFAGDWLFRMKLARRKLPYTLVPNADGTFPLEFNSEQTPLSSNRVTITPEVDRHGLRRVHLAWRLCQNDVDSAYRGFLVLRDAINKGAAARLQFDEERLRDRIRRSLPLGGHHIGTARMANTERSGVVGPDCAVFGLSNLFIASSAVFPTSGYANPTLTIVALALRLAQRIKKDFAAAEVTGFQTGSLAAGVGQKQAR